MRITYNSVISITIDERPNNERYAGAMRVWYHHMKGFYIKDYFKGNSYMKRKDLVIGIDSLTTNPTNISVVFISLL